MTLQSDHTQVRKKRPAQNWASVNLTDSRWGGLQVMRVRAQAPYRYLPQMKKISVVSPFYNEEDNVETCYETVKEIFERDLPGYAREHIFIDNSSSDRTVEILKAIAARDPAVKIVVNARNFGVFRSTFNGLRHATGDATLVMLPVDLQDPAELLPEFVKLWESGYEIVAGARSTREETFALRTSRKIFYRLGNALSDFELWPDWGEFNLIYQ